jgi:PTH1 family peptidyl-tRNA hydrolase
VKLIVGLGNPGRRYAGTRHNVGFRVVERLAERARVALDERRFDARFGRGLLAGEPVALLLPETFMNASGRSVEEALASLAVGDPDRDLLVVLDDADLPLGRLRLRAKGSSGGHNGLEDVLVCTGGAVPRLRFGIGRPAESATGTVDYVLARFSADEEPLVAAAVERACDAIACFVERGIGEAMNRFNGPG